MLGHSGGPDRAIGRLNESPSEKEGKSSSPVAAGPGLGPQ